MVSDDLPRRIRERLDDPEELCRALGLLDRYKRQPGGVWVLCPVHGDRSPSCSVTVGDGGTVRVHCFACDFTGDALTLIAVVHRLDPKREFPRLLEVGAELAGIAIDGAAPVVAPRARPAPSPRVEVHGVDDETFDAVVAPLARVGALDVDTPVSRYLAGRGLLEQARADGWFSVGPDAGAMLVALFGPALLMQCGLTDERGNLKWSEHSLAIPWRTPTGLVQTIQRRHLGSCEAAKRYVFPTGRGPAHPYGVERLATRGPVAIVEGAVDVLAWRALDADGFTSILGAPGVSGWRASWDPIVRDRIAIVAFDDDEPGTREAMKLGDRFHGAGAYAVRRATPKRGQDWAESMRVSA